MLIVVAVLFTSIVKGDNGLQVNIKKHGDKANQQILGTTP
jgi:hypothetical protein